MAFFENFGQNPRRIIVPVVNRPAEPEKGAFVIDDAPFTIQKHRAKVVLRFRVALSGCPEIPGAGGGGIFLEGFAGRKKCAQCVLGGAASQFRGFYQTTPGSGIFIRFSGLPF